LNKLPARFSIAIIARPTAEGAETEVRRIQASNVP